MIVGVRGAVEGAQGGSTPLVKIKRDLGDSAPVIDHTVGWIKSQGSNSNLAM